LKRGLPTGWTTGVKFFSFPQHPYRLWGTRSFRSSGY
jgi:hypothetical protein